MKGVILGILPDASLVDLTHDVPAQQVEAGAFALLTAFAFFPAGTIHLAVVDPGVGTERKIVAARSGGHTFVGPGNGVLRWALDAAAGAGGQPAQIVQVEEPRYRLEPVSNTFHGRDVMAPAAAYLASGVPLDALGPPVTGAGGRAFPAPERRGRTVAGCVVYVDHFGNCITNLDHAAAHGARTLDVAGRSLRVARTYGDGAPGECLAVPGSSGFVEIAVRGGSAARELGIGRDAPVAITS
jgi:S-adenosylmethionine hydrolase